MMPNSLHRLAVRRRPVALLTGCAIAAIAAALPAPTMAQALQGNATTVGGTAPTIITAPNYTQVFIGSVETVLNWAPFDTGAAGIINFLPAGATAEFAEPSGTFDYTILNRILPVDASGLPVARPVAFNGTVTGLVGNSRGGNIWFYSPTGIIAGPTATFNVGSLVLTTNDIVFGAANTGSSELYGPSGLVRFRGPVDSFSFIEIQGGAQIDAQGSAFSTAYVALVAPRITQGGTVRANGNIAYLAAEQVDMTINGGLFDFTLTVGSTDGNGVVHTGTTTGPASTSSADAQRITMVALPKNDAMTMLLSGSIGYTPAASAAQEGSSIILAVGFDTSGPNVVPANRDGSIRVGDTVFRNRLSAFATDTVTIAPSATAITFENDALFHAVNRINVIVQPGETVDAKANLWLRAGQPGLGGIIDLRALGTGQILVAADLAIDATSASAFYDKTTSYLDGIGGSISLVADGGLIRAGVSAIADASGRGRYGGAAGGFGTGGLIDVYVEQGGEIEAPDLVLIAQGGGGDSDSLGGAGVGGTINVFELDGQLDLGLVGVYAGGFGGDASIASGDGTGGSVNIEIRGQAQDWDQLFVDASGAAGIPSSGGPTGIATALPDAISLLVDGTGALTVQDVLSLTANSFSGYNAPAGFVGQAGGVLVQVSNGGSLTADYFEAIADATITGDLPAIVPDTTPVQQAGTVSILADGGTIAARVLFATADAYGLAAQSFAGSATGGTAQVSARNGGSIQVEDPTLLSNGFLRVSASGFGEAGLDSADAFGGTARLVAADGSIGVVGDATVTASASHLPVFSVFGGDGHNATGGTAEVELLAGGLGSGSIAATNLNVLANGDARLILRGPGSGSGGGQITVINTNLPAAADPLFGDGGTGTGGTATITVDAGTLTVGQLALETTGIGGGSAAIDAPSAFQSGDGFGGTSQLLVNGGTATATTLTVASLGQGGGGGPTAGGNSLAAFAGNGTGGGAFLVNSGALTATDTSVDAFGVGGAGMDNSGLGDATGGGQGVGGVAHMMSDGSFDTTTLTIRGNGIGGDGGGAAAGANGDGGDGIGQFGRADLADGAFSLSTVTIEATGSGGNGDTGGNGIGGLAGFAVNDSVGSKGARSLASLAVDASGFGGAGSVLTAASTAGLVELEANALDPSLAVTIAGDMTLSSLGTNAPVGDGITATVSGAPLMAGGNIAMNTVRNLTIAAGQPLQAGGTVTLNARTVTTTGRVASGGAMSVVGPNGISAGALTSGGTTLLQAANGALAVTNLNSAGGVTALARSVSIGSSGALSFADVDATAGNLAITTAGNLGLVTADATGTVTLSSTGGIIAATGAVNSGGAVSAIGQTGASFTTLVSGGTTLLRAPNGAVGVTALTSPGAVTASGRSVNITSPGALTFADLDATAGAATVQTAGNLTLSTADATGALSLRSTGGDLLTTGAVNGGSVALTASGAVQANANVAATGTLAVDAGGTFTLNAVGRGATVNVLSNDIVLGTSAALGARGQTTALTLVNRNPARVTYIGGGANPAGYSLDQAEAARLFADGSITIGTALTGPAPPAGQGTVSVGNLAMSFGAGAANNIGTGGELEISTPGRISITGNVALATSSATDTFTLDPTLIELDTSTGSIAMLANGAPLGRLNMIGGTIAIATSNVLPQLSTLTDFAAIKALLDQPGGNPDALRAGSMTFNAAGGLYIQNAGATALYRDRRGFTAGAVAINTGSAATRISVNGQILTAGGPLLGLDTQTLVTINGAPAAAGGQFDPASTINGCLIGARCAPPPGSNPPSDSDLNDPVLPGPGGGALFAAPLIELAGTDPLIAPPLVDEPITGVGNDDLWQPRCEDEDEDGTCPEADREP